MLALFQSHGAETVLLTDVLKNDADGLEFIKHRPNMTYTRDLAAVFQSGAVLFVDYLEERGIERIGLTDQERHDGLLNVVVTQQGKKAIGFEGADRIGIEMAKRGWQLDTFPSKTLFLGNGGAHCMSCPILVR